MSQARVCGYMRRSSCGQWLQAAGVEVCVSGGGATLAGGGTLCYQRDFWAVNPFADVPSGEDTRFVWSSRPKRMAVLDDDRFYVALMHAGNTSPRRTGTACWQPEARARIQELMGEDWGFYGSAGRMMVDN